MTFTRSLRMLSLSALLSCCTALTTAAQQMIGGPVGASAMPAAAATGTVPARPDLRAMTRLSGHVVPWAQSANDAGPVAGATVLHLDLLLQRAPARQAAFEHLLADQQDPKSPRYHSWLTPAQIGLAYGPAQADLDLLLSWLAAQGLSVDEVTPSRTFIRVSAPAGTVERAFAITLRSYNLGSTPDLGAAPEPARLYRSATTEPAIPTAFLGLIAGIGGLTEAPDEPLHRMQLAPPEAAASAAAQVGPLYTSSSTGAHYVAPGDFSILYDVPAASSSANDGTGQKIAIIGRSRVNPADISNFLISVGLPAKTPNVVVPPTATDPGQAGGGDQGEATLDVQRVLGTAPGAQADLVVATNASGGIRAAIQYNVQTLLDPVMTISFGSCEVNAGLANVQLYTALFAQAAAEGISVFVSAGDSGAAGCDAHGTAPPTTTQFASINYICSSGFATCVGGTEFNEGANPAQYWSATNSATRTSALSYIPEGVWNEPTIGNPAMFTIGAGGGGVSIYTPKPVFQAGPGVPADGFRDTPDVSFTSSGHDAYFGCYAASGGTCVRDPNTGLFNYVAFYGTSAAAPSLAGVTALLNQSLGAAQGNLNPLLYRLGANAANGVFHDATVASSGVAGCTATVPSLCNNSTPSATALTGGLAGYVLTAGYDLASGLGSPDVAKLFTAAISAGAPTTTALTGSSGTIPSGQSLSFSASVAARIGAGTPTGTVQFFANGTALGAAVAVSSTGTASLTVPNQLPVGTDLVTAAYSGDTNFASSNSAALTLTIQPGTAASTTIFTATPNPTFTNQTTVLKVAVTSASGTGTVPTGSVALYQVIGTGRNLVTTGALSGGVATFHFSFSTATFNFSASYLGDGTYASSASAVVPIVSSAGPTTTTLTGTTNLPAGSALSVTATIDNLPVFPVTSTVTFMDGNAMLGKVTVGKTTTATSLAVTFTSLPGALVTGIHSITAVFAGDLQTQPSTSLPLIVAIGVPQAITVTPAAASLTFTAGTAQGNTDVLTIGSAGAFAGTVTVSCAVSYNGTASAIFAPTCTPSSSSVMLTPQGTATTTLTIATTAQHALLEIEPFPWLRSTGITLALLAFLPLAGLRRRNRWRATAAALCLMAGMLGMAGCGGSGGSSAPAPLNGTTPGSYTITVTSSGTGTGTVSATTTIGLTVQ